MRTLGLHHYAISVADLEASIDWFQADPFDAVLVRGAKHVGFLVENVDAAWDQLRERGAQPLSEPADVPPAGVRNCWFRDPDGTQIEVNEWLNTSDGPA